MSGITVFIDSYSKAPPPFQFLFEIDKNTPAAPPSPMPIGRDNARGGEAPLLSKVCQILFEIDIPPLPDRPSPMHVGAWGPDRGGSKTVKFKKKLKEEERLRMVVAKHHST